MSGIIVFMMGLLILKTKDISYVVLLGLYGVDIQEAYVSDNGQ
jgi:hypothetical protein